MRLQIPALIGAVGLLMPHLASAEGPAEGEADGGAAVSLSGDAALGGDAEADADAAAETDASAETDGETDTATSVQPGKWNPREDQPWLRRWAPEPHMIEVGLYGGLFKLAAEHELFVPDFEAPNQGWQPTRKLNPDLGLRVGYYPLRFFGAEIEGGVIPSQLDAGGGALLYTARGHVVGQLGLWSVTPFVLVGGGMLGVRSDALGNDLDGAVHFGGGVKVYLNRWVMMRLDVRDVVGRKLGVGDGFESHNLEVLLGLSITLNRKNRPQAQPEPEPEPEPVAPGDRDGDGILDEVDACIDDPETVNDFEDEDGCPEFDGDGDGFWDSQDSCPEEPGVDPDGCPLRDTDGDGIFDDVDSCVDEPETVNGFEDEDGCPDEVPEAIKRFTGTIKGITFDTNKATIKRSSIPVLDEAVRLLLEYPSIRIEIAGHTDNQGAHDHNMQLSSERAESVKGYLVGMGVAENRVVTRGYGPDVPIESNETKAGRANNRRIEFRVLSAGE